MDEPAVTGQLERRCAEAVRRIPLERIPIFAASCAERFFAGYAAWVMEEKVTLPRADLIRRAVDMCWTAPNERSDIAEVARRVREADPSQLLPVFSSHLSVFSVELDIVKVAMSSILDPTTNHGLHCSLYSLDFHSKFMDLRRDLAGIGPNFSDPGRDIREFEVDPGAVADAELQLADVNELTSMTSDSSVLRGRSIKRGDQLLRQVLEIVR